MNPTIERGAAYFHAGLYLSELLAQQGRDVAWLSEKTGLNASVIRRLLTSSNMDAGLFVRLGCATAPSFPQGLDRLIFAAPTA